jgi:hypothetical protein
VAVIPCLLSATCLQPVCAHCLSASSSFCISVFVQPTVSRVTSLFLATGHTWKSNSKWYTQPPELLCNFYNIYIIYTCDRRLHNRSWRAAALRPMFCIRLLVVTLSSYDHLACVVDVQSVKKLCFCPLYPRFTLHFVTVVNSYFNLSSVSRSGIWLRCAV